MTPFTTPPRLFLNVQGLRALAALAVFGLHLNVLEVRFTGHAFLNVFAPIGNWGVDLFFVISGFVMITSTWDDFAVPAISWKFFLRRLIRIYPPYLLVLVPITLLYLLDPGLVNASQAVKPNILASYLLLPQQGFGLLIVSWTLVYEMFFYAVFALVLAADRRYCLPLMAAWGAITIVAHALVGQAHNVYLDVYSDPLLIEFIFGVIAGYLVVARGVPSVIPCLVLGIVGIIGADLLSARLDVVNPAGLRFLWVGVPVALFFLGVVGLETRYGWTAPGWALVIGNASYSLYLWHIPLAVVVGRLSSGHQALLQHSVVHAAWLIACLVFVVGCSIVLYYAVERPLLRFFSRRMHQAPVWAASSALVR